MEGSQSRSCKRRVKTEVIVVYDIAKDCFVQKEVPKLKSPVITLGFDLDDQVRTPILQILRAQEQDRDPRTGLFCVQGNIDGCTLYDDLVKASNRFVAQVSKRDQGRYLNPPERVLLNAHPPFCEACIWAEHARRRRESSRIRRFKRWLWPSR